MKLLETKSRHWKNESLLLAGEIIIIIVWALIVTRPYQTMDPTNIPIGVEYLTTIPSHYFWTMVRTCGWCSLWNGSLQGGAPSFVDTFSSKLHPVVAIPTLIWGVHNGAKMALVTTFLLGGLSQWWFAYTLGFGRISRTWNGCMAIVAGYLSGRMNLGAVSLLVSIVAYSMVLPPLIAVTKTGSTKMTALLGLTLGLFIISGQGYFQVGALFFLPIVLTLAPLNFNHIKRIVRQYALAIIIAMLIAAPFLVPFIHFLPQFSKFTMKVSGQILNYVLFYLVNDDFGFYLEHSNATNRQIHPWLYINYIGWVPVMFILWAIHKTLNRQERRMTFYLLIMAAFPMFIGSKYSFQLLTESAPTSWSWFIQKISGLRYYQIIAIQSAPPLLALSALGLEELLQTKRRYLVLSRSSLMKHIPWGKIERKEEKSAKFSVRERFISPYNLPRESIAFDMRWGLIVPLALSLYTGWNFTTNLIQTRTLDPEVAPVLDAVRTSRLQWINVPGAMVSVFVSPAVDAGFKIANGFRTWQWKDRPLPEPMFEILYEENPPAGMKLYKKFDIDDEKKVYIYSCPLEQAYAIDREYALVTHSENRKTVCFAHGVGGFLDVFCNISSPGTLVVKENSWEGWEVFIDGRAVPLKRNNWLSVDVPLGNHTIQFRYYPWDVPVGIGLCVGGIALFILLWNAHALERSTA